MTDKELLYDLGLIRRGWYPPRKHLRLVADEAVKRLQGDGR